VTTKKKEPQEKQVPNQIGENIEVPIKESDFENVF